MKSVNVTWVAFLQEGRSFRKTAQGSVRRPEIFTPAIIQNIVAMGIEKYFMAIFTHRGILPRNHTMTDLLEEAEETFAIGSETAETLRYMDSLQRICSIDDWRVSPPKADDVGRFLSALEEIADLAESELSAEAGACGTMP